MEERKVEGRRLDSASWGFRGDGGRENYVHGYAESSGGDNILISFPIKCTAQAQLE